MFSPIRSLLVLAVAGAGSLFFTGCDDRGDVVYDSRPAYYGGGGDDVDFYYVGGRPYSHSYGELVFRDGGYYYNRGGTYVVYERDSARHGYYANNDRSYARRDYRNQRETNYRNEIGQQLLRLEYHAFPERVRWRIRRPAVSTW